MNIAYREQFLRKPLELGDSTRRYIETLVTGPLRSRRALILVLSPEFADSLQALVDELLAKQGYTGHWFDGTCKVRGHALCTVAIPGDIPTDRGYDELVYLVPELFGLEPTSLVCTDVTRST